MMIALLVGCAGGVEDPTPADTDLVLDTASDADADADADSDSDSDTDSDSDSDADTECTDSTCSDPYATLSGDLTSILADACSAYEFSRAYGCETADGHPYDVVQTADDDGGERFYWFDGVSGQQVAVLSTQLYDGYCCSSTSSYTHGVIPSGCDYTADLGYVCP